MELIEALDAPLERESPGRVVEVALLRHYHCMVVGNSLPEADLLDFPYT